ncbi:MAG: hypothetical protein IJS67_04535, partial [Clostridia bacterium]|nr:hypothetical protein [Clostridia bacterium]
MKNEIFDLKFDKKTGKIYSLKLCGDEKEAEFLKTGRGLAEPRKCDAMTCGYPGGYELSTAFPFNLVRASENERGASAKFVMKRSEDEAGVTATEKFYFDGDLLKCEIVYKNENDFPVYFKEGDIAFYMPFYDNYDNSEVATSTRCHEHINAAGENSYIMLERMGVSEYNLGVIFLSGNFPSYSQEEVRSNDRGYLIINAGAFYLNAKKRYAVKFALFRYTDRKHFFKRLKSFDEYLHFEAVDG